MALNKTIETLNKSIRKIEHPAPQVLVKEVFRPPKIIYKNRPPTPKFRLKRIVKSEYSFQDSFDPKMKKGIVYSQNYTVAKRSFLTSMGITNIRRLTNHDKTSIYRILILSKQPHIYFGVSLSKDEAMIFLLDKGELIAF
jgi:hypothetical protein